MVLPDPSFEAYEHACFAHGIYPKMWPLGLLPALGPRGPAHHLDEGALLEGAENLEAVGPLGGLAVAEAEAEEGLGVALVAPVVFGEAREDRGRLVVAAGAIEALAGEEEGLDRHHALLVVLVHLEEVVIVQYYQI